jgi:AraC family transcriptional regulator
MNKAVLGDSSEDSAPDLSEAMDVRFRQQLTDLLATRRLAAHTGTPTNFSRLRAEYHRMRWVVQSIACARTSKLTSRSLFQLRMLARRVSVSVAPLGTVPDCRRMLRCASDGLNR